MGRLWIRWTRRALLGRGKSRRGPPPEDAPERWLRRLREAGL
ncbi:hypothetical protein ACS5PM_12575 [Ideonella sp. YS5]